MKQELGDPELVKISLTNFYELERQGAADHFQSRLQYIQRVTEHDRVVMDGLVQYGLQTLRWLFLLNAGAIAIVVTYLGAAAGKSPTAPISAFAPLIIATAPFAMGCVCVIVAGLAAYFNFCYASATLPSSETLFNFLSPVAREWPKAKFQQADETAASFHRRYAWKTSMWRFIAITAGLEAVFFFLFGVYHVLRVVIE